MDRGNREGVGKRREGKRRRGGKKIGEIGKEEEERTGEKRRGK